MWCVKELVEYKNLKSEFSIILTKWYVNSNIKDFTSLPSIGFILTKWHVSQHSKWVVKHHIPRFILTMWYVNAAKFFIVIDIAWFYINYVEKN
ncbi:TPA: hypothetical protein ACG3I4_003810 [Clostridioides difficile]|nr:hypothetical protein [Clostridioides difficile]HBE9110482.1 hypothetical protein [Clostridioides difficile]HBG8470995.1 hypothetical protein [Clostridioides difficile]HBH3575850.1 hypothetical protein [Clostridioides difficile]